ncbi:hypothetical protein GF373_06405 [bacterium]|nr:hypothetical protein [bacterium]
MPLQQSLFHVFSQILIEEYRKDHPGASAREVVQSCPNWQPVMQSIKEIFNQYTPAPEARDVVSNPTHFAHQISVDEEAISYLPGFREKFHLHDPNHVPTSNRNSRHG